MNPFLVALTIVGFLGTVLGVILTVLTSQDWARGMDLLTALAGVLLAVGAPALAGAGVLAGVEWSTRQRG